MYACAWKRDEVLLADIIFIIIIIITTTTTIIIIIITSTFPSIEPFHSFPFLLFKFDLSSNHYLFFS
jgi:hypothetical protein